MKHAEATAVLSMLLIFVVVLFGASLPDTQPKEIAAAPVEVAQAFTEAIPLVHTAAVVTTQNKPTSSTAGIVKKALPAIQTVSTPPPIQANPSATSTPTSFKVERLKNAYTTPPLSVPEVNTLARAALVNIVCNSNNGTTGPISGSGVVISTHGLAITNAHVAQYILLAESGLTNLQCKIRSGYPAHDIGIPEVVFMPKEWVAGNARKIKEERPTGTGELDFALIRIKDSRIANFAHIDPEVRPNVAFSNDPILVASYPAEFIGGLGVESSLYPVSSVTSVSQLLSFGTSRIDVLALGGVIGAQGGSSGGSAVNAWGKMVGLITTTTAGATTASRDLHAVTFSYIDQTLKSLSGLDLSSWTSSNIELAAANFKLNDLPVLIQLYLPFLK